MFDFFKRYEVHLSPEVHGRITLDGKSMPNLKVMRAITYEDEYLDKTETDEDGRFHFGEKNIKSRIPGRLFDETRTRQIVVVDFQDARYLLWHVVTSSIKPRKVLTEKLSHLNCDLNDPEEGHHFTIAEHPDFTHNIRSICRWE